MPWTTTTQPSSNGVDTLHIECWTPDGPPRAMLQIAHGMVEFIHRYDRFGQAMADAGILVVGNDHVGHGASVRSRDDWGYFADHDGDRVLLADLHAIQADMRRAHPELPTFLLGHSMGSFLVRQYLVTYPDDAFDGVIVMGTATQPKAAVALGQWLAELIAKIKGPRYRSSLLTGMALGRNNKPFEPARTPVDWLTRDEAIVDRYVVDDRNRFQFTASAYADMFRGMRRMTDPGELAKMDRATPILIVSGGDDPVGRMGKAVGTLKKQYDRLGMRDVSTRVYAGARHEILNELNHEEVTADLVAFIDRHVDRGPRYREHINA